MNTKDPWQYYICNKIKGSRLMDLFLVKENSHNACLYHNHKWIRYGLTYATHYIGRENMRPFTKEEAFRYILESSL